MLPGRTFIARHGETVFNAAGRIQGEHLHTPLTRRGFNQAEIMGETLRERLGIQPPLTLWASDTGRALQTLAIICEWLELDWHQARADARLVEIGTGEWGGRYYRDLRAEQGPVFDADGRLQVAPAGETYPEIAARVTHWARTAADDPGDRLVIMHGISSRVLRGVLTGLPDDPAFGAPIASGLPQGSIVMVEGGVEQVVRRGADHGQLPA